MQLGTVDRRTRSTSRHGTTDAAGVARFTGLPRGEAIGYAAVVDWHGMRLGTQPFTMPETGGVRAEIHALERTSDPSVITIGTGGRVILQMHEDMLQILEMLPLENSSDKLFDPGPGARRDPAAQGVRRRRGAESDAQDEIRQNYGIAVHGPIAPKRATVGTTAKNAGNEMTFGFVVPYHGATREFVQPMPNGLGPSTLIIEQIPGPERQGPGIGARQSRELNGRKYWVMPIEPIAPGGVLVHGDRPAGDRRHRPQRLRRAGAAAGRRAVVFGRRPKAGGKGADGRGCGERARTADRAPRGAVRRAGRRSSAGARAGAGAPPAERRNQLVAKLEAVYRDLAALDEQRAP